MPKKEANEKKQKGQKNKTDINDEEEDKNDDEQTRDESSSSESKPQLQDNSEKPKKALRKRKGNRKPKDSQEIQTMSQNNTDTHNEEDVTDVDDQTRDESSSSESETERDNSETSEETTRQRSVAKRKPQPKDLQDISLMMLVVIVIMVIVVLLALDISEEIKPDSLGNTPRADEKFNYPKVFTDRLEQVRQLFPNQTERFWRIIKARGLAHLRNRKPSQPLVFMMGAPPAAHSAVDCIAKQIAWTLDPEVTSSSFIDGAEYSKSEGHRTKKVLDEKLEEIFQRGVRSALIMHLDRLPPPSPFLFFKYCDNDEAPFKHAGIIFTVHLPYEPDTALTSAEAEGTVETYLEQDAWSKYPYESDSIAALLSHVADTVVLASGETDEVIRSACNN